MEFHHVDHPDQMFSGDAAAVQDADPRLNCDPSTLKETKSAVIHMNIGKSPERFDIYAKIFMAE